jgi:hypothetical protein
MTELSQHQAHPSHRIASQHGRDRSPPTTLPAMTTAAAYKDRQFLAVIGDEARHAATALAQPTR